MKYFLILVLVLLSLITSSQNLIGDSTSIAIRSYFENQNSTLSNYFDRELILDIKGQTYFSSFDEFDLFLKYVLETNSIEQLEYFNFKKDYLVIGKSGSTVLIFDFTVNNDNKIDYIYIGRKKAKKLSKNHQIYNSQSL